MKLTVKERFGVMALLPAETNWVTRRLIRGLLEKVGFSAEEHEKYKFQAQEVEVVDRDGKPQKQRMTTWNTDVEQEAEFDLKGPEVKLIVEGLEDLDKAKKLTADHDTLCEKFLTAE
ncbi:MAG TPA: hypothetical protein VNA25_04760 [Phycisphaerae bacterium]|nr:hypothetical protein [Phycisphaerae bacterium]